MDNAYKTPRWAQVILWMLLVFGITAPLWAEDFKVGEFIINHGVNAAFEPALVIYEDGAEYICILLNGDDKASAYAVLFSEASFDGNDMVLDYKNVSYIIGFIKDGEELKKFVVYKRNVPCIGICA